ncbi:PadR family transcriptional regulator [Murinocardiopsis flavida]|uniref:PadR family transcriptional regulator n=1 Tax=Murinocardiopsis flavida TaxID=645275 RepID=A0A2P8DH00_9ACTN|nr:PadR family transcriptional regulator [Murinocardiopsis flavida]PSK96483.1 PadR family transcriptional regulator [Murinocardiopsis flavida]
MSATRLLVLGVVRMQGRTHGYRIGRELLSWGTEQWANVKWGSIYHALRQLTKEGRLRTLVVEGDEVVDRTSYELTAAGDAELHALLRGALRHAGDDHGLLCAGVTLMCSLPRAEVVGLLKERLAALEQTRAELTGHTGQTEEWGKPEHVRELFGLWLGTVEAGAAWTRSLIAALESGRYVMADDGPGAFGLPERTA